MYFNRSDCAKRSKFRRICNCNSCGGVEGVGMKVSPLSRSFMSSGVRSYVLRLCIVSSGAWCGGLGTKKTGGMVQMAGLWEVGDSV